MTICVLLRTMLKMLTWNTLAQDLLFEIITMSIVLKSKGHIYCDTTLTGCSSSWALTSVLGRAVLVQNIANVKRMIINVEFEMLRAQKALNKEMLAKNNCSVACKQSTLFWIQWSIQEKRTLTGEMKLVESETLCSSVASFFCKNDLVLNVAESPSFAALADQCIKSVQQLPGNKSEIPKTNTKLFMKKTSGILWI